MKHPSKGKPTKHPFQGKPPGDTGINKPIKPAPKPKKSGKGKD
jgi:hypothetical protein